MLSNNTLVSLYKKHSPFWWKYTATKLLGKVTFQTIFHQQMSKPLFGCRISVFLFTVTYLENKYNNRLFVCLKDKYYRLDSET